MALFLGFRSFHWKFFSKLYWLKGLKPKNKGHRNVYECSDLTKKVYLILTGGLVEEKTTAAASTFPRRHPSFNFEVMGREMVLVLPNSDGSGNITSFWVTQKYRFWMLAGWTNLNFWQFFLAYIWWLFKVLQWLWRVLHLRKKKDNP